MGDNIPKVLTLDASCKEDFYRLNDKNDSPLCGENKRVFMMAMVMGYIMESRKPLKKRYQSGILRTESLKPEDKAIIKALALAEEKDLSIYSDKRKIYTIAEEYASGGIKYLKEDVFGKQHGSYVKRLESDLVERVKKIISKK